MSEIKRCPCGGEAIMRHDAWGYWAMCSQCSLTGTKSSIEIHAEVMWEQLVNSKTTTTDEQESAGVIFKLQDLPAYSQIGICKEDGKTEAEELPGGSTPSQYALPPTAKELQDLIEHREMNFAVGNIFKACYRLGRKEGVTDEYDLRKILFFAERELKRVTGRAANGA